MYADEMCTTSKATTSLYHKTFCNYYLCTITTHSLSLHALYSQGALYIHAIHGFRWGQGGLVLQPPHFPLKMLQYPLPISFLNLKMA